MAAQARLDVKVTGDASGALKAIQSVRAAGNEAANKFREQSKEAIGAVVRSLNPIVIVGTAAASAIMGVGQKISEYFEEGRETVKKAGEELTKNAEAAGVTERAYQQLRTAAEKAGIAQDEFNAKMQALKEGKETVAALVEEWGKMPEKIGLTADALERYQLEAAARRQKKEAEDEARNKNMSAVSYEDELVGEFWARVHRGENADAVQAELVQRMKDEAWFFTGTRSFNLDYRLSSERHRAEMERMNREWADRERQEAEEERQEAEGAKRRTEERKRKAAEQARYLAEWKKADEDYIKQVEAVGGIENFAIARAAYYANAGDDPDKWDVAVLKNSAAYRQEMERYNATAARIKERKTATEIAAELAGKLYAGQQAAAKQADEAAKKEAKEEEEKRKADEAANKQREALKARREELNEWYKQAKAEAQSYSGGYQNAFGLAFGGGDLIGAGRYRAVTRLTEAAKQLQISEKLLEVNRQMNEKLKALEE